MVHPNEGGGPFASGTENGSSLKMHYDYEEAWTTADTTGYVTWVVPEGFDATNGNLKAEITYTVDVSGDTVDGGANDDVDILAGFRNNSAGDNLDQPGISTVVIVEELQDTTAGRQYISALITFGSSVDGFSPGDLVVFKLSRRASSSGSDNWPNALRFKTFTIQYKELGANNKQWGTGTAAAAGKYWDEDWFPAITFVTDKTASKQPALGTLTGTVSNGYYSHYHFLQYSATVDQFANTSFVVPEDFDNQAGSFSVRDYWESDATTNDVVWQTALLGIADGEPDDAAFVAGDTEAHTADTVDAGGDRGLNITTHTMSGTVSLTKNDLCQMRVGRLANSDANDNMGDTARLIGRSIQYLRDTSLGGAW
jgi:hypothetical protein